MSTDTSTSDILWHHSSTGETQILFMDRHQVSGRATVDADRDGGGALVGLPWSIVGVGDFNKDGDSRYPLAQQLYRRDASLVYEWFFEDWSRNGGRPGRQARLCRPAIQYRWNLHAATFGPGG